MGLSVMLAYTATFGPLFAFCILFGVGHHLYGRG